MARATPLEGVAPGHLRLPENYSHTRTSRGANSIDAPAPPTGEETHVAVSTRLPHEPLGDACSHVLGDIERDVVEHDGDEALEREGTLPEADLRKALHGELVRFLRSSWRRAQLRKKDDPISNLAREMDLPVALAREYAEIASRPETGDEDEPDPSEE